MAVASVAAAASTQTEYTNLSNYGYCVTPGRKNVVYITDDCTGSTKYHFNSDGDGSIRDDNGDCLNIVSDIDDDSIFQSSDCSSLGSRYLYQFEWNNGAIQIQGTDRCMMADRLTVANGGSGYNLVTRDCNSTWPEQQFVISNDSK
eukprot:CFRG7984T1